MIKKGWIIDWGALDHMTPDLQTLLNSKFLSTTPIINLPTGDITTISHSGTVILSSDLVLQNVMCVPSFKDNLLSVQMLVKDANCEVQFFPIHCNIVNSSTKQLKRIGGPRMVFFTWI